MKIALLTVLATWIGCIPAVARAQEPLAAASETAASYRVGPGDVIAIQVYGEPTLSADYPVTSAGDIDFPLLGRIPIEGQSTTAIGTSIRDRLLQGFIHAPNVTVAVRTYASQPVQVLGAVGKPGLYFLQGPTTVLQVLSLAGGVATEGVHEVRVTHGGANGTPVVLPLDQILNQTAGGDTLASGDVVFVPQSLVSVSGYVDEPGEIAWRDGLTLSNGIAAAGGALDTANLRRVWVLRGDARIKVNVRRILRGKDPDFPLQDGDRVYINESVF